MRVSTARLSLVVALVALAAVLATPAQAFATSQANPLRPDDPYCWAMDPYTDYVGSTLIPNFTEGDDSRQCVEYVKRFYYYGMGYTTNNGIVTDTHDWYGNAYQYFGSATVKGLAAYDNGGSTKPEPGDIFCMTGGVGGLGHVAIVTAVTDKSVTILSQNGVQFDTFPLTRRGSAYSVSVAQWGAGYGCRGWLRRKFRPATLSVVGQSQIPSASAGSITLSQGPYVVGQTITGSFTVKNTGDLPGTWAPVVMALRGPAGENRDAQASGYLTLAPGASVTLRFSKKLDLAGTWTGSVSGWSLSDKAWQSPPGANVAFVVEPPTGTMTVNLKYDDWLYLLYSPHINPAIVHIYGPNGYYRSASYGGTTSSGDVVSYRFAGAPVGPYRVRVEWADGNDSAAQEANQYFSTSRSKLDRTCDFTSP